jgi:hypothetical protein
MGEYRAVPSGTAGVKKLINERGECVGQIRMHTADTGNFWSVYLGPGRGVPATYQSVEAAYQAIVTHAEAHPNFTCE